MAMVFSTKFFARLHTSIMLHNLSKKCVKPESFLIKLVNIKHKRLENFRLKSFMCCVFQRNLTNEYYKYSSDDICYVNNGMLAEILSENCIKFF